MIISASRRTDIPKLYSEWFFNRLQEGYVYVRNPMNFRQVSKIALNTDVIDCFVFWSKDPEPMLSKLSILDRLGFPYYFQFTLTPYGKEMETNLRDKRDIVNTFKRLSEILGPKRLIWRYDPIILNNTLTAAYHIEEFELLCRQLSGYTSVCEISFVDIYQKLKKVTASGMIREIDDEEMFTLTKAFVSIGNRFGIQIKVCCEEKLRKELNIPRANCIDKDLIEEITLSTLKASKISGQRLGCGCLGSIDIGLYNTCNNGCKYCYANLSIQSAGENYLKHNPNSELLLGEVTKEDKITDRKISTFKI